MEARGGSFEEEEEEEEEETIAKDIEALSKFDGSIDARQLLEEIESPAIMKRSKNKKSTNDATPEVDVRSPRLANFRRYSAPEEAFDKAMTLDSETSDSEESDEMDIHKIAKQKHAEFFDLKNFDDLEVSSDVKELFQNITRYTPQKIDLNYKLIPFIPNYIPAVGDIDAFLKVPRPDGVSDQIGLTVLDEPAAEQSEPAVLHLQLRSKTRSATGTSKTSVVKRLEDVSKQGRMIDKWIEDMGDLHRSKHPPAVELSNRFPDVESLLCQWPPDIEEKLNLGPDLDFDKLDCNLLQLIDLMCALLDIPVYGNESRIESLYTLFSLYTQVHNIDIQTIHQY